MAIPSWSSLPPRTRWVGALLASCLGAGVAFHVAMQRSIDTAPYQRRSPVVKGITTSTSATDPHQAAFDETTFHEDIQSSSSSPPPDEVVEKRNKQFRQYLQGLEHKDQETKLKEMSQALEYFHNPHSYAMDVRLKRVNDPASSSTAGSGQVPSASSSSNGRGR